jgi:tetratricopeptide (TPR) repeat protein
MRKPFLIAALLAIAAGSGAIHWSLSVAPSIISDLIDPRRFVEANPAKPKEAIVEKPAAPQYRGQSLTYLGDTAILAKYPNEFVDRYRERLANVVNLMGKYPKDDTYWIELGIIKKQFDNYLGTRDAWQYALMLNSKNPITYYNLGSLYGLYLNDPKKAEENFQQSLKLDPTFSQSYLALAEFYGAYKEKSDLVDDVLLEGLRVLPGDHNLILHLAIHYKSVGDKENAIKYFEQFLKLANLTKSQVEAVKKELESLRS